MKFFANSIAAAFVAGLITSGNSAPIDAAAVSADIAGSGLIKRAQFTGDMTFYDPSVQVGSCGWLNGKYDMVVAINAPDMANAANPNSNPRCGTFINIYGEFGIVTAKVVDTCPECAHGSIDVSVTVFKHVQPNGDGRVHGISWDWAASVAAASEPAPVTRAAVPSPVLPIANASVPPPAARPESRRAADGLNSDTGDMTWDPVMGSPGAIGSCGFVGSQNDWMVSINTADMGNGANPNANPKCGQKINVSYGGKTRTGYVSDTCPGCLPGGIDVTKPLFLEFADPLVGRLHGVTWTMV